MIMSQSWIIFITITFLHSIATVSSQPFDYPTANLSTSWINSVSANNSFPFDDTTLIRPILLRGSSGPRYASGFYCNGVCDSYLFAIFIVETTSTGSITMPTFGFPEVVWSANRDNPVGINATLDFTAEGDLILRDANGTLAWSTNTSGRGVVGLNLTEVGNLVLFDANSSVVWQSFDHPSDCLVPSQILAAGMSLTAFTQGSLFSLSMTDHGLVASIQSHPPQVYYNRSINRNVHSGGRSYADFQNGSLAVFVNSVTPSTPDINMPIPVAASAQVMNLGPDGHLRVFEWGQPWKQVADVLTSEYDDCKYPLVCGRYGICSDGQCICPQSSFRQIDDRRPDLGCVEVNPLTCNASESHSFLEIINATYFTFVADIRNTDISRCREVCLKNCSCRAVVFRYSSDASNGDCYLPNEVFSMMNNEKYLTDYYSSVSIKVVQTDANITEKSTTAAQVNTSLQGPILILGSTLGVLFAVVLIGISVSVYRRRKRKTKDVEEDYLDHVPGMPTRFSYEELASATDNFIKKLGGGGFGSVYEGSLSDGTKIAVKRLDGVAHIKKSFIAEVESIGNVHHINLVRLIGFCADKTQRLLVYEYMCNGSLEKWIYDKSHETSLDWNIRRKIILDVAKGLAYLHDDCRQKVIHLDIKPQNILLDEHYNAKLADFGLSKLIDRDQSEVVTTMRGTPGYLAPEWLSAVITEKVDVYSFGVVVLEILSGRKIFVQSKPEEERYLPSLFKKKAEEGLWLDLVDKCCQGVDSDIEGVEKMMQISAWCLQNDHENRPSMSMVIKVMEGDKEIKKDIDHNFLIPQYLISRFAETSSNDVTRLPPSLLSGPR